MWSPGWGTVLPLGLLLVALGGVIGHTLPAEGVGTLAYPVAALLGALTGAAELAARYRDAPMVAVTSRPGLIYVAANATVSFVIFWLVHAGQLTLPTLDKTGSVVSQVLVSGVGAMALFRTSVFTLRVKETDIPVGPAAFLQVLLAAADRACDRDRAGPRAQRVTRIMRGVSFVRARLALPLHCLALMQNISTDERTQLNQAIDELARTDMSDEVKGLNLGLLLMNYVGEDVLQAAVDGLGTVIKGPPPDDPPILAQATLIPFADLDALVEICIALDPVGRATALAQQRRQWLTVGPALTVDADKVVVVLARLRQVFGPDTLSRALAFFSTRKPGLTPEPNAVLTLDSIAKGSKR